MRTELARWTLGTFLLAALWFASLLAVASVDTAHGAATDRHWNVAGANCREKFTVSGPVRATDSSPPARF